MVILLCQTNKGKPIAKPRQRPKESRPPSSRWALFFTTKSKCPAYLDKGHDIGMKNIKINHIKKLKLFVFFEVYVIIHLGFQMVWSPFQITL